MSLHTNDLGEERQRPVKIRSKIDMTKEFLHGYLGIPSNIEIISVEYDHRREIVSVILSSDEIVSGRTFHVGEGMEIPNTSPTDWMEEAVLRRFRNLTNNAEAAQALLREEE